MKNFLTVIGGIFGALGPVFVMSGQSSALWWVGMSFSAVSPVLIGSRGMFDTKTKE